MYKNTYHTLKEAKKISGERILKDAKAFSEKIISKQRGNQFMSIEKNGKIYYTSSEVKEKLKKSIRMKAKDVAKKIKGEITFKDEIHV